MTTTDEAAGSLTNIVRYPRFRELHEMIRECQEMSTLMDEAQCMSLEGFTGAGKSTVVKTYAGAFPHIKSEAGTEIPVFYMETPSSPVTVKGLAEGMLQVLGDPAASKGTLTSMTYRLTRLIITCKVQLLILDDFHHLIDADTQRVLHTVSDWLKVLIKETKVPVLVVGYPGEVVRVLQANAQLSRLFPRRETLHPLPWSESDHRDFTQFVKYAEKAVGKTLTDELPREELLYRMYYATNGFVGHIMNLMRGATHKAKSEQILDLQLLIRAFDHALANRVQKPNPFTWPADQAFIPPLETPRPPDLYEATGRRSRGRTKRDRTVQEVLKTKS